MKILATIILVSVSVGAFAADCCKGGSCDMGKDPFMAQAMIMAGRAAKLEGDRLACSGCAHHGKMAKHHKTSKKSMKKHRHGH